jgi:hypothetical protein
VLINDFSARDVQADEMASVGFGFVKCKSFCTAMGSDVVTADELWMHTDMGKMFCGEGLKCEVRVNGEPRGPPGNTAARRCCLLSDYVKHVALGEGLYPGEVLGLGTVPGCCGLEIGEWLKPGDEVTVACEGLGTVTNTIPAPAAGPNFRDLGRAENQPGRLASASGQHKRAKFPTSKAHISAVFHSFWLTFGRAIISRNGLEARMCFP